MVTHWTMSKYQHKERLYTWRTYTLIYGVLFILGLMEALIIYYAVE